MIQSKHLNPWDILKSMPTHQVKAAICAMCPNWQLIKFDIRGSNVICEFDTAPFDDESGEEK